MYTHLRWHSTFSFLEGIGKIDDILAKTEELNMNAICLAEYYYMAWAIQFYQKAIKKWIKPIIGVELWYTTDIQLIPHDFIPWNLVIIAKNFRWYQNILSLVTDAHKNKIHNKPTIDNAILQEFTSDIYLLCWWIHSFLAQDILAKKDETSVAEKRQWFQKTFGKENVLLDIIVQNYTQIPEYKIVNNTIKKIASQNSTPLLINNDFRYTNETDKESHEVWLAIKDGRKINDPYRRNIARIRKKLITNRICTKMYR